VTVQCLKFDTEVWKARGNGLVRDTESRHRANEIALHDDANVIDLPYYRRLMAVL
jgi:hypothetical protein